MHASSRMTPLLSVVVPIYNIEEYLKPCIDSICGQTYTNLEIILVDDGSTDSSGSICDCYAKKDARIKVIHKENGGLVSARKAGMRQANGELIANIDGDDWIAESMFEHMVRRLSEEDADVVQCAYKEGGLDGITRFPFAGVSNIDSQISDDIIATWLEDIVPFFTSQIFNKIYKRDIFCTIYENVPDEMSFGEDLYFYMMITNHIKKIVALEEALYYYRVRPDSISHVEQGINYIRKKDALDATIYQLVKEHHKRINHTLVETWFVRQHLLTLKSVLAPQGINVPYYKFPQLELLLGRKVVVYGAGMVGRDMIMQLSELHEIDIVGWVDRNPKQIKMLLEIMPVEQLGTLAYDYVIVAIQDKELARKIKDTLVIEYGVQEACILWDYDRHGLYYHERNTD